MNKESRSGSPVVGGSSLLVIFAVLCLTVFALLGLSSVQASQRLSENSARAVAQYYEADACAEEIFARLRAGELPEGVTNTHNIYAYTCPISDTLVLHVELRQDPGGWTVLRWQSRSVAQWEPDEDLVVWDGT